MNNIMNVIEGEMQRAQAALMNEKDRYKVHILSLTDDIPEPKYLFRVGNVGTIPSGELVGLKGKAKQGKSQLEYYLIGCILGANTDNVKCNLHGCKTFLFDTEQSKASLKKCCGRALQMANLPLGNYERFKPFFMRPLSIEERRHTIEDAVEAEHPDIIFIDGVRDLLQDFNSLEQSNELIQWLMGLTAKYGCTIVSVLHQNKAKDDSSMRGHLGTELLNKLTDCFEVTKKDGAFHVSCTDSRNVPCEDFAFSIDAKGNFRAEQLIKESVADSRASEIQRVLGLCFKETSAYGFNELVRQYALEGAVSESTAKRRIGEAKAHDYLVVSNNQYQLNPRVKV